jgi:hypothetical protein
MIAAATDSMGNFLVNCAAALSGRHAQAAREALTLSRDTT